MNERFKELAEQATRKYDRLGNDIPFAQPDLELFAELIIRECQHRVEQYINECGEVASMPDTVIMKHFGVEE